MGNSLQYNTRSGSLVDAVHAVLHEVLNVAGFRRVVRCEKSALLSQQESHAVSSTCTPVIVHNSFRAVPTRGLTHIWEANHLCRGQLMPRHETDSSPPASAADCCRMQQTSWTYSDSAEEQAKTVRRVLLGCLGRDSAQ